MKTDNNGEKSLSQSEYKEMLCDFMPSKAMRKYLAERSPDEYGFTAMICGAPVSLEKKAKALKTLSEKELPGGMEKDAASLYRKVRAAMDALTPCPGEFFLLARRYYRPDANEEDTETIGPFLSMDAIRKCISRERGEYFGDDGTDKEYYCRYEIEKWVPDGEMLQNTYTYRLIDDEIVYFEKNFPSDDPSEPYGRNFGFHASEREFSANVFSLDLPVPFHAGDILEIDCRPFRPKLRGVVLEVGDNRGSCCFQMLTLRENGEWQTGAVKRGTLLSNRCVLMPSMLYTIEPHKGKLSEEEQALESVRLHLRGEEKRGSWLWNKICRSGGSCSDKELIIYLSELSAAFRKPDR